MPASSPLREAIRAAVESVRADTPMAQSFTNFVTINLVANAQLAAGGTAAMSFLPDDVIDIAAISGATYINVGTLLPFYKDALGEITKALHEKRHRWVLDPVAAGLGATRTRILDGMRDVPPAVVRANASEILTLESMWNPEHAGPADDGAHGPAGVESTDDVDTAARAAERLALYLRSKDAEGLGAVAVSGETDLVTDGKRTYRLPGGDPMMTKITGAGCALGGVVATYLCVADPLVAALAASLLFKRAGERAAAASDGPGSFQTAFLDALWNTDADDVASSTIWEA
ncbi:hydroxyethylthiazole kinase family protein [Bifidobacterium pseudolongum]|nr:hydroxyethylthiazole kinase family protein [Bifidobacterium pseudolongum]